MKSLIENLQDATDANWTLDAAIAIQVGWAPPVGYRGDAPLPDYTGSVDDALAMMREGGPHYCSLSYNYQADPQWRCILTVAVGPSIVATHTSLPIAICIAALLARLAPMSYVTLTRPPRQFAFSEWVSRILQLRCMRRIKDRMIPF